MARGKSSRKYKRRKKYGVVSRRRKRKRRAAYNPRAVISSGFPKSMMSKVSYAEVVTMDPGSNSLATYVFNANQTWDPDYQVGGHQPLWNDQFRAVYSRSTVVWSKIHVQYVNNSSTEQYQAFLTLREDTPSFASQNINTMLETAQISKTIVGTRDSGQGVKSLTMARNIKKFIGRANWDPSTCSTDFAAAGSPTEPVKKLYWVLGLIAYTGSADPSPCPCRVKVDYIVRWDNRKEVAGS